MLTNISVGDFSQQSPPKQWGICCKSFHFFELRAGMFLLLFFLKLKIVKRKSHINRTSISDIIFLMMSNAGMTQEQAATTLDSILAYMKQHGTDSIAKLARCVFGGNRRNENASLN